MNHFRLLWKKLGTHVHVQFYGAEHVNMTHASLGQLVFRETEWEAFLRNFSDRGVDTITIIPASNSLEEDHPVGGRVSPIERL